MTEEILKPKRGRPRTGSTSPYPAILHIAINGDLRDMVDAYGAALEKDFGFPVARHQTVKVMLRKAYAERFDT